MSYTSVHNYFHTKWRLWVENDYNLPTKVNRASIYWFQVTEWTESSTMEPVRKRLWLDTDKCIICFKPLGKLKANDKIVKNPTLKGMSTILKIAHACNDEVFEALWPVEDQLWSYDLKVNFHKSCRAAYIPFHRTIICTWWTIPLEAQTNLDLLQ